jgi:hypothetical protein
MTDSTSCQPKQVYELEGMLVAPRSGATSTFEDYAAARATFIEINDDARWNPWVHEDRASEERSAMAVMEQWTRAEPGFHQTTEPELKKMLDEVGQRSDTEFADDAARQERDKERYDPEREQARLSLLEQESILNRQREEIAELRAGRYPAWGEDRGATKIAEIESVTTPQKAHIATLAAIVGDREERRR